MANTQQYIDDYIRQYLLAQEQKKYNSDPINRVQDASSKIDMAGKGLSSLGGLMSKAPISGVNTLGQGMQSFGNALSGGATKVSTALNNLTGNALGSSLGSGALSGSVASGAAGAGASAGAGAAAGGSAAGSGMAAGPMGALVALGIAALKGDKRNAAKQQGQAMLKANEEMNNALMQESEQQQAQNQQQLNNIVNNSNIQPTFTGNNTQMPEDVVNNLQGDYGFMTGGAAPVQNNTSLGYDGSATQYLQENMPRFAGVRENNEVKQGILNKLASGIGDFAQGYQENRNTGFAPENLMPRQDINTFKQNINPADYTTKLNSEEQKQFNIWADDMKSRGMINPNDNFQDYDMQGYWKNEVLNNTDLANGNAQNHFTDKYKMPNHETFSNESQYATGDNARYAGSWNGDKFNSPLKNNKMTRAGEFLGSAARIAQNPGVQALLAGGISTALTGNPLYGAGMAYKFGNQRAMSELYRDVLAQNGIQTQEPGIFGNVSSNDMKNIGNMMETKRYHDIWNTYRQGMLENTARKQAETERKNAVSETQKAEKLAIDKQNANSRAISANAKGSGKGGYKPKPQDKEYYNDALAEYSSIVSKGNPSMIQHAKQNFIKRYGIDPDTQLKNTQSGNPNNRFDRR